MEANVLYVRAADQGYERAIRRIAAIQAAAEGEDPQEAAELALTWHKEERTRDQKSKYQI